MSNYANVTDRNLNNLGYLSKQQRNQQAIKIRNKIKEQTHD